VRIAAGSPLVLALLAMAGGMVAGVVAVYVMVVLALSVLGPWVDSRAMRLALFAVPAVTAAAGTWVIAGYLR
jgi:hypothetical protein